MNSLIKLISFFMYFLMLYFVLASFSLFFIWIFMEISIFLFIFIVLKFSMSDFNFMMNYYIVQVFSSSIFLFSLLLNFFYDWSLLNLFIFLSMWLKLGFFPFSTWYFQLTENLSWDAWFMVNSFQKFIPLWVLSFNFCEISFLMILVYVNSLYGFIEIWSQSSVRWMLNSSSLNHFGWMVMSLMGEKLLWILYFFVYVILLFLISFYFKWLNFNLLSSSFSISGVLVVMYSFLILNFLGLPPFLGFYMKLLVLLSGDNFFIYLILLMNNIVYSVIYIYFLIPNIVQSIFSKMFILSTKYILLNMFCLFIFFIYLFLINI